MPYGNKTQDKILIGQRRLTHWKSESSKGPKKRKQVEDKSPEDPGTYKKKKRSPKVSKQLKEKSEDKPGTINKQKTKMDQERV